MGCGAAGLFAASGRWRFGTEKCDEDGSRDGFAWNQEKCGVGDTRSYGVAVALHIHVKARTITARRNRKQSVAPAIASKRFAWVRSVSMTSPWVGEVSRPASAGGYQRNRDLHVPRFRRAVRSA